MVRYNLGRSEANNKMSQEIIKKIESARKVTEALLRRPIAYHPIVAKAFGSVKLAVMWSQLYYWSDKGSDPEGWIYKTQDEIFEETGLGRREQETARKLAVELGVIEEKRCGTPPKMHFRIDMDNTLKTIAKYLGKEKTEDEFNWQDTLDKMFESERQDINVIAFFFLKKKISFESKEQYQVALRRHLRIAKDLIPFTDKQIELAAKDAEKEYPDMWTLETLVKLLTKRKY